MYFQVQFGGLRSGWGQFGVGLGCQARAGCLEAVFCYSIAVCLSRFCTSNLLQTSAHIPGLIPRPKTGSEGDSIIL